MNYTKEEKDQIVRIFFDLQESEVPVTIRTYAAHVGVKYYTFRDWYRDYKASAKYQNISTEEYSKRRRDEIEKAKKISFDEGFPFVQITRGGLQ